MKDLLSILSALSDETRLRAVRLLDGRELCLCQIIEVLGLSPSTVSKHMSILFQAGLVDRRKEGKWHYYRLAAVGRSAAGRALKLVLDHAADDGCSANDRRKLEGVERMELTEVCACYRS